VVNKSDAEFHLSNDLILMMKKTPIIVCALFASGACLADGSPWLLGHEETTLRVDVVSGSTDRFFIGENSIDLMGDLEGTYLWLNASRGYDDIWAFDFRTGYARTNFDDNPDEQSDIADTTFGVTYQFLNEFELDDGTPTVSGRIAYTVGGDYDTNITHAIGDGGSGIDLSLLVGKSLSNGFATFGDLTYRQRDNGVADGFKFLASLYYTTPVEGLGLSLSAAGIRTNSSVDIDDPDFSFEQFAETDRDSNWVIFGANYGLANGVGLGLTLASVIDGKNVADSNIATLSLSYSF